MPTYLDLLKLFEQSQFTKEIVLELPRPLEEAFPEIRQSEHTVTPLRDLLKKDYDHLVTAAFSGR